MAKRTWFCVGLSFALGAAACPDESAAPTPAPPASKPVREPLSPETKVSLKAADQHVPVWIKAYEAIEARWDGTKVTGARVERYQRGKCLRRQLYAEKASGTFISEKLEIEAAPAGTAPGGPLYADLAEKAAAPRNPNFSKERDDQDRLTLTTETVLDKAGARTDTRVVRPFTTTRPTATCQTSSS